MSGFPWLPLDYALPGGAVGRIQEEGPGLQILRNRGKDSVYLLLESDSLAARGVHRFSMAGDFAGVEFGSRSYLARVFEKDALPVLVRDWPRRVGLLTSGDASRLGEAVQRLRSEFPKAAVSESIYLPEYGACLPVEEASEAQDLRELAGRLLAAGVKVNGEDLGAIRRINSWLTEEEIREFFAAFGVSTAEHGVPRHATPPANFSLPGRPELENFFREYILEPSADRERYAALGVKMPNGILLYGPTGSGKSHAVGKLAMALGWPVFEINLASVGSSFIHQTSVSLQRIFDSAKRQAPALVLLEEIDALAVSRGSLTHDHKVEEVADLLRLIESAGANNILVLATTNWPEALDPAMRRKGRFDHAVEVGYPTASEVRAALDAMIAERPHREFLRLDEVAASLSGRPMSDVAWLVNEAARRAARAKKDAIEEADILLALRKLTGGAPSLRLISR